MLLLCQLSQIYRTTIHTQEELFSYFADTWIPRLLKICHDLPNIQSSLAEAKQSPQAGKFNFFSFNHSVEVASKVLENGFNIKR